MTMQEIFDLCIIPLLAILTTVIVYLVKTKCKELAEATNSEIGAKYLTLLGDIITDCVQATNQTYVESLKKEGKFDLTAQKVAFNHTKTAVLGMLSDKAVEALKASIGDLDSYIDNCIESEVYKNKQ